MAVSRGLTPATPSCAATTPRYCASSKIEIPLSRNWRRTAGPSRAWRCGVAPRRTGIPPPAGSWHGRACRMSMRATHSRMSGWARRGRSGSLPFRPVPRTLQQPSPRAGGRGAPAPSSRSTPCAPCATAGSDAWPRRSPATGNRRSRCPRPSRIRRVDGAGGRASGWRSATASIRSPPAAGAPSIRYGARNVGAAKMTASGKVVERIGPWTRDRARPSRVDAVHRRSGPYVAGQACSSSRFTIHPFPSGQVNGPLLVVLARGEVVDPRPGRGAGQRAP